jgi:hypothetical protein
MSKLYVPALALALLAGSTSAQQGSFPQLTKKTRSAGIRPTATPIQYPTDRAEIWSDDFSDPNNWVVGVGLGADADNWVIGTAVPSGDYAIDAIVSTTADNGYGLYDSDLYCGGNQNAYLRMATPVDLSASTGVVFQFEQNYRNYQGTSWVEVSTDGGNSWEAFEVNAALATNESSDNPELVRLNITSAAAGQASVLVQFRYEGGCDYAWMVDDVAIIDQPENDLVMNFSFIATNAPGYQYCRIPSNQLEGNLEVGAEVYSFGYADQTNVSITMELRDAANNLVVAQTSAMGTMSQDDTLFMDEIVDISTLAPGIYTGTFVVSSDQSADDDTPENNTYLRAFQVNNTLYSLDGIDIHPAGYLDLAGFGSGSYADDPILQMFTYYQPATDVTVESIEIEISANSSAGSFMFVAIYDSATVLSQDYATLQNNTLWASSDPYTITAGDVAAGSVSIPLDFPLELPPGGYYASVTAYQDGTNDLFVLDDITVGDLVGGGSLIYVPSDETVYGNGNAFAIRLGVTGTNSISENNKLEGISMYPNPTNGILRINSVKSEKYTVEVLNVLGAKVMTNVFTGNTVLDLAGFADGVYSVRVSNGTQSYVQRITLN